MNPLPATPGLGPATWTAALAEAAALHEAPLPASEHPAAGRPAALASGWMPSAPAALEPVAPPLTPAWVTLLQPPALHLPVRPRPPAPPRRAPPDPIDPGADDEPAPPTLEVPHDELPALVRGDLRLGRGLLLLTTGHDAAPHGCWLALDDQGRPQARCTAVRGGGLPRAAVAWWQVRREATAGAAPRLLARAGGAASPPLWLRAAAPGQAIPPCPPGTAWLDLLEPPRHWRELRGQWSWLVVWAARPPRWMP